MNIRQVIRKVRRSRFIFVFRHSYIYRYFKWLYCYIADFYHRVLMLWPINDIICRDIGVIMSSRNISIKSPEIRLGHPAVKSYKNIVLSPSNYAGYQLNGSVVPETVLNRGYQRNCFYSADKIQPIYSTVIEKAFFGGHIIPHYGHLITESISRFWALDVCDSLPVLMFVRGGGG